MKTTYVYDKKKDKMVELGKRNCGRGFGIIPEELSGYEQTKRDVYAGYRSMELQGRKSQYTANQIKRIWERPPK